MVSMPRRLRKAVIPVAGLGTRMLPATKAIPKELLPIYDKPIIEHVVHEAIDAGIEEIILVTRSGKEAIENHFDANYELEHRLEKKGKKIILKKVKNIIPPEIILSSVRQNDALGLGHAVLCAKRLIGDEPFAVLLPDVLVLDKDVEASDKSFSKMVKAWESSGLGQIMVEQIDPTLVENYGIVDLSNKASKPFESIPIKNLLEKPNKQDAPSDLAVLGRYVLPNSVLDILTKTGPGIGGEIQLTDALDTLISFEGLNSFETNAEVFDCGSQQGFLIANLAMGMRDKNTRQHIMKFLGFLE